TANVAARSCGVDRYGEERRGPAARFRAPGARRYRRRTCRGLVMARRHALLSLALAATLLARAARADVTVDATLSPRSASVGEPLQLVITVVGAQQVAAPNVDGGDDFDVQYIGPSTQISIVNGHMDQRIQHNYALVPKKSGSFVLVPFSVEYDGKHYQTQKFKVDIAAAGQAPGSGAAAAVPGKPAGGAETGEAPRGLRLVLAVPRREIYLHERVPIDLTLYVPPIRAGDVQYPTIAADGLSVEKLPEPGRRQQYFDQKLFTVLQFHTAIVPMRAGALTLGPATERLTVGRDSAWPDDPFFSRFFRNSFTAQRSL